MNEPTPSSRTVHFVVAWDSDTDQFEVDAEMTRDVLEGCQTYRTLTGEWENNDMGNNADDVEVLESLLEGLLAWHDVEIHEDIQ